jgi:hypothetical protein
VTDAKKPAWEMSYEELFQDWNSRHAFGSKGSLSLSEAREIHNKWKSLGQQAQKNLI